MGETTKISWTNHTWNPWQGCRKVSPGCKHCYAERLVEDRMGKKFSEIRRSSPKTFNAPLTWKESARVFTCSISDFFIEEADAWRDEAWEIIRRTPHLTYQILTKRPERIEDHLPRTCFDCNQMPDGTTLHVYGASPHRFWPWPNVWLGTSVEDQKYAEVRIPQLVSVPAKVHFLSCEPLLGPIDFFHFTVHAGPDGVTRIENMTLDGLLTHVEWVITGGESGPNFRAMLVDWARTIRDQCVDAHVPFFFKQSSGPRSEMNPMLDGKEWRQMPDE